MANTSEQSVLTKLMSHYTQGTQDIETRRTRKPGGWNDIINAYMGKLPANWPYLSQFTDPIIKTTILEKTARLLNAKLQGRLVPREGGDMVGAKINAALLDFQWDNATNGGGMLEKVANADQITRLFGIALALVYWDTKKNTNEIKILDPRDVFLDPSATHIRNARYVQIREFTTPDTLEKRGYNVAKLRSILASGGSDYRSTAYMSQVLSNRNLDDMVGRDLSNPILEIVTEHTVERCRIFCPRHGVIIHDAENTYDHKQIPLAQLRYYPIIDDVYGESEVESVLPLQKVINACLCAYFDEVNIAMRPPLKIVSGQVRMESIEYGPGAQWIMNSPNAVSELQMGANAAQHFTQSYSAFKAAFQSAMGSQSLGVSNIAPFSQAKTATEVNDLTTQQNTRDQYNQLYLAEFLKDIMMMWHSNNQQYLFDDPTKLTYILKIIGKDKIKELQQMKLDQSDIPDYALREIAQTITENPQVTDQQIQDILSSVAVPTNPVILNPHEANPAKYVVKKKLTLADNGQEADLTLTKEDLAGVYDYIPDVTSMAAGAGVTQQRGRMKAYEIITNPVVQQLLQQQGETLKIKELLINILEDNGEKDAEALFDQKGTPNGQPNQPSSGGPTPIGPSQMGGGVPGVGSVPQNPPTLPSQPSQPGISPTQGLQGLQ